MKNVIATILLFISFFFLCSQTKDEIGGIKTKYQQINQNIKTYSKKTKEDEEQSTDGGTITGYYNGKQLQLIKAAYLGETGKIETAYYFENDKLIFVVDNNADYNRPYYWDKKMAKENNDKEWFDPKKTKIKTSRFYFGDGKLIKWVNNKNKEISVKTPDFLKHESEVLQEVKRLERLLN